MTILQMGQGSHILEFTNSFKLLGWMHKASFDPVSIESHYTVALWIVWTIVSNEKSLYSQHIRRTENIIADSFLRDFHRSYQTITKKYRPNPTTTNSGIIPHQTSAQERQLLDIIDSRIFGASNGIAKATATKQSGKWYRWCTFLKYLGIVDELLEVIPQEQRTFCVSSFSTSVQRNQICTTRKQILLHRNVKSAISDVSASFRTHLLSDLTLESSGQKSLLLQ